VDELDRLAYGGLAPVHRPDLHHLVVAGSGFHHLPPFPHGVRRRLFDVHVLARHQAPDGRERVPVIGGGDDDGVDILVVEDTVEILDEPGLVARHVLQRGIVDALGSEIGVDVAEGLDLDLVQLCETALHAVSLAANANAGDNDAVVRAEDATAHRRRCLQAAAEQVTADRDAGCRSTEPRREVAPGDAAVFLVIARHVTS